VLLSQFVIGLISTNQHWFACAPLSEAELERVSLNASQVRQLSIFERSRLKIDDELKGQERASSEFNQVRVVPE